MLKIIGFVFLGYGLGLIVKERFSNINQKALSFWLLALLFAMGISITTDPDVINNLKTLGFSALILATFAVIGSILGLLILNPLFNRTFIEGATEKQSGESTNSFLYFVVLALILGSLSGLFFPSTITSLLEELVIYFLYLLLFSVGYDLYCNRHLLAFVKKMGFKILLIPLLVIIGSLVFTLPLFLLLPFNFGEVGAVVSGFGWYSLSSIIIGSTYSPSLGIVALLCNVFREIIAFIITPLLPKLFPSLTVIAPAGATAMDTLLPLITKSGGSEYTVPALVSGIIISTSVYFLVPLFIQIAHFL
ncbi:lysine exporter LysO family protein [Anaerobranca gottschalkii]|uniref:Uncharacterized membrane protein YbjE, DUF340 family n=1 Tax=Anaerobranca gottschalkii DSM 13577 TaxID=1120990 RepID=A0A1I0A8H4_9FIRM|nr:lysine exporter LysO family protein [Anaerobranca gottschalkii]SES90446.1 Uncharacterized membrane protein YbjE, DUF340 family [Anaerobranca gottschalkii DSM 13577]